MTDVPPPRILVSPAEPPSLRTLGSSSPLPERYGVDFLFRGGTPGHRAWFGCQRKELSDFIASVNDGRLAKELAQMRVRISLPLVIIEGQIAFTTEGELMLPSGHWGGQNRWTAESWFSLLMSARHEGAQIMFANTLRETAQCVSRYAAWSVKDHSSLRRRGGAPGDAWGRVTNRDYALWLLQGLPDVGPKLAEAILDHFGRVPFDWSIDVHQLMQVKGIGKPTAVKLIETFQRVDK